jgi:hypothetical protein
MAVPRLRPSSGKRLGPKMMRAMKAMRRRWVGWKSPSNTA